MKNILLITFLCLGFFLFGEISHAKSSQYDESISLSMEYLSKSIASDGRFIYRKNLNPQKTYSANIYSSLRHTGTLYSMYLYERYRGDTKYKKDRLKASQYLIKENYIQKLDNDKYMLVSKEKEDAPVLTATLGGAGLGLSALSNLYPEKKISYEILEGLGNFIIFMQKPSGNFYLSYVVETKKRDNKTHAARFYPGEACLGLLYLYEVDPKDKWLNTAKKGLLYLAKSREHAHIDTLQFDHWAMLATKKLFDTPNNGLQGEEKILLQKHAGQMAELVVNKQNKDGSFKGTRTLCGTGTILEGLVGAYTSVSDEELKYKIMKALYTGNEYTNKYQVKTGKFAGGVPDTDNWNNNNATNKDKEIRIDNVQHVMSGWITFVNLFSN